MTQTINLQGIFPPLPTPFTAADTLDMDALSMHVAFLEASGIHGCVVLGSNGEAVHLDVDEQQEMIRSVRKLLPSRLVVAGTGAPSTRQTIARTQQAADDGADAALILPPHYYRTQMTPDALLRHYSSVADASPIPVIVYNMPSCTGLDLQADLLSRLSRHPNIQGLKDSSGNVSKLAQLVHDTEGCFQILAGSAGFLLPALAIGCTGSIPALANIAPYECLQIYTLTQQGDWCRAREIQVRLAGINHAVTRRWGVAGLKAAMDLLGLPGGPVRLPLQRLSEDDTATLRQLLIDSQLLC